MPSVLSRQQREVIIADTRIDRLVVDRVVDAFDALLRDDRAGYVTYMRTAIAQMGYEGPITANDRPTAVDKLKTICIHAIAREHWRCSYRQAHARLTQMIGEP